MLVNKEIIKDGYGKIVGYIDTDHTGNKTARDFYGRIVARGDVTTSMLYRK